MSHFNPDFWEIPVDYETLAEFDARRSLWYETEQERELRWLREQKCKQIMPELMDIIENRLTSKQRQAIMLYFFGRKTQEEIGHIMGIPHQVVSQHIYGIKRNGKKIGGSINKIKKTIRKMARNQNHNVKDPHLIQLFNQLLDQQKSHREGFKILHSIINQP